MASSRTCPASSTPVGPAPTMTTVSQYLPVRFVGRALGELEGAVNTPANLEGVVDRLHSQHDERELVVAEVGRNMVVPCRPSSTVRIAATLVTRFLHTGAGARVVRRSTRAGNCG